MRFKKFTMLSLLAAVSVTGFLLAILVERQATIGRSLTPSPDGNWSLRLKLVEYSTLFKSRKTLWADIEHATNEDWSISMSVPLDEADGKTISNQDPEHSITWSDDSSTVTYWINDQFEDSIRIETDDRKFKLRRKLNSFSYTYTPSNGGQ